MITVDYKNEQDWLNGRKSGIGGSDASAVIGFNDYMTNVELWAYKTGLKTPEDISKKKVVIYGNEAEPLLRKFFELDHPEFEHFYDGDYVIHTHDKHDFLKCSLDGRLIETATGKKGIFEAKTTEILNFNQWAKWKDQVPENYFVQCLHCLLVTNFDFIVLSVQIKHWKDGKLNKYWREYRFNREDYIEDLQYLLEKEIKFWDCVKNNKKPNRILPKI